MYSAFLLWLMSELFEQLPEVGDPDKPKFVMFFDEAHLLFDGAPSVLVDKVEQVVRLIRSKGVGIYFVTQNPLISFLDENGMPTPVEVAYVYPPKSQLAPITEAERAAWVKDDDLYAFYKDYVDNESAFEVLNAQADLAAVQQKQAEQAQQEEESGLFGSLSRMIFGTQKRGDKLSPTEQIVNSVAKSVGRNIRNEVTKQIMRGILGALKK